MTSTGNKEYIPELWLENNNNTGSGLTMAQVSPFVTAEIAKGTADLLKLDGTRPMTGNLDLATNDLTKVDVIHPPNPGGTITVNGSFDMKNYNLFNIQSLRARTGGTLKFISNMEATGKILDLQGGEIVNHRDITSASDNAVSNVKDTRHNYMLIDTIYDKSHVNIFPVTGQKCTASSQYLPWGARANPENVFDNNQTTQWLTGAAGQRSWIKVELATPIQIWKVQFWPRLGHQMTTQLFLHYWLEASNDDVTYEKILESTDQIDQMRSFELTITKPYKYWKFEGDGKAAMGLSEIQMFQATVFKASDINSQFATELVGVVKFTTASNLANGMVPYGAINSQGNMELAATTNLLIDSNGKLFSAKGMIDIGGTLNMMSNNIQNIADPQLEHEAATKRYVDNSSFASFVTFAASKSKAIAVGGKIQMDTVLDSANWNNEITLDSNTYEFIINNTGTYKVYFNVLAWAWGSTVPQIRIERIGTFKLILVDRKELVTKTASNTMKNIAIRTFPDQGEKYKIFCNTSCTHWIYDQCTITFEKLST